MIPPRRTRRALLSTLVGDGERRVAAKLRGNQESTGELSCHLLFVSEGCRAGGRWGLLAVSGLSVVPVATAAAAPSQNGCDNRTNNTYSKLLECVRLDGVRAHQAALQAIADANGGTRAAGTSGYTDSVDYVVDTLEAAGWNVTLDEFPFTFIPPPTLRQLTPVAATYETGAFTGSGFGTVTGNVIPVDINLVPPRDE